MGLLQTNSLEPSESSMKPCLSRSQIFRWPRKTIVIRTSHHSHWCFGRVQLPKQVNLPILKEGPDQSECRFVRKIQALCDQMNGDIGASLVFLVAGLIEPLPQCRQFDGSPNAQRPQLRRALTKIVEQYRLIH